eukprot:5882865-Prorocentrum_lima.AAC.1
MGVSMESTPPDWLMNVSPRELFMCIARGGDSVACGGGSVACGGDSVACGGDSVACGATQAQTRSR